MSTNQSINVFDYLNDPETEKKFKKFLRKEKRQKNLPSEKEKEEIKKLERQALNLWRLGVKIRAKGKCEFPICKKTKRLNAHHIESFTTNRTLRYDLENGICLCPTHHKFGWLSAHRSFCFVYELLFYGDRDRRKSFFYLLDHYKIRELMTKEQLLIIIENLSVFESKKKKKR